MAEDMQEDLSMEDILSSIKNILIEDNENQTPQISAEDEERMQKPASVAEAEVSTTSFESLPTEDDAEDVFDLSAAMRVDSPIQQLSVMDEESDPFDMSQELAETEELIPEQFEQTPLADEVSDPFYEEEISSSPTDADMIDLSRSEVSTPEIPAETQPMQQEEVVEETNQPSVEQKVEKPDASDNMLNNFAKMFTPSSVEPASLGNGNKTLETLVKEVIADEVSAYVNRHLENVATNEMIMSEASSQIKNWIDSRLQKLVEEVVRQEIVRVMARAGNN